MALFLLSKDFRNYLFQDIRFINSNKGFLHIIQSWRLSPAYRVLFLFRLIQYKELSGRALMLGFLKANYIRICGKLNVSLPINTSIGEGVRFPHNFPVVINSSAIIGKHVIIHPCVLIGRSRGKDGAPIIKDYVFIGHGSKIIGNPLIGEYSFISPGAVVTKDVPAGSLVGAGVNNILNDSGKEHYLLYV